MDLVNALGDVASRVLLLPVGNERIGIRASDPDKDHEKIRLPQQVEQLVIVREIDRCLGREFERIGARLEPPCQVREKLLQRLLVADEIVVNELDHPAPPEAVKRVELGQHLLIALGDRKSTRLNSSHLGTSYAVFCLK